MFSSENPNLLLRHSLWCLKDPPPLHPFNQSLAPSSPHPPLLLLLFINSSSPSLIAVGLVMDKKTFLDKMERSIRKLDPVGLKWEFTRWNRTIQELEWSGKPAVDLLFLCSLKKIAASGLTFPVRSSNQPIKPPERSDIIAPKMYSSKNKALYIQYIQC